MIVSPTRTLCGGGTSSPQIGVPPVVTLSATGIFAFLSKKIDPTAAEVISGILAASLQFAVGEYCANDPPADPGIGPSDVFDAMNFTDAANQAIAVAKLGQWFLSQYWYTICQCDAGTQPTPPALSNPGPVGQDTGIPGAQQKQQCWNTTQSWSIAARTSGSAPGQVLDLGASGLPAGQSVTYTYSSSPLITVQAYAIPSGVSQMALGFHVDQTGATQTLQAEWLFLQSNGSSSAGGLLAAWQGSGIVQSSSTLTLATVPSNAAYWALWVENWNLTPYTGTVTTSMYCAPGTSLGQQACCPPDTSAQQMLLQIVGILNSTRTDITNLQTDITTIDTNLTSVSTDVTNLQTDITTLSVDVTNLQTDVTNLQTTIDSETNTTITNVNTTVTATDTTVNTINTTVNDISAQLTLNTTTVNQLQSLLAPLGYTLSTAHAGLSGDGSFGVTGVSGVLIQLTATPPGLGFDVSVPDYIFDVGWMSILDSNGFIDQARIHSSAQVWQSRLASEATVIGYSLTPGVVATITEIVPKVG